MGMESFSTVIVVFWIFAALVWIASLTFISIDRNAKDYRWLWFIAAMFIGPIILVPYWFWGRDR